MRDLSHVFVFHWMQLEQEFIDYEFVDGCSKGDRRQWRVTYNTEKLTWYGMLVRAETEDTDFNHPVNLPVGMVEALVALIPADKARMN